MEPLKGFKDFLWLPYLCANLFGLDPTAKRGSFYFKLQAFILTIGMINHLYLMVFEVVYLKQNFRKFTSLLEATKTCAYMAYGFNTNTKAFAVLWDLRRLKEVVSITEILYPKSNEEKLAFRVNQNFWPKSIYILVSINFIAGWSNYFLPGIHSYYMYLRTEEEFSYATPFFVAHPFNYRTQFRYPLAYFSEVCGGHLCVCLNMGVDLILCCMTKQMSMHFKYIGQEIERYIPTGKAEDNVFIAKLIERHQLILKLCLDLNEIFGISLVFNFLSSSGVICLTAFQVTFVGLSIELLKFLLFLCSTLGQLFIVCFFGDELISCSLSIAASAYNHPWYRGSNSYRKQIIILILRCQKPATIIAKGFSTVSFITFKQVTSMSYKIFALLNTIHEN